MVIPRWTLISADVIRRGLGGRMNAGFDGLHEERGTCCSLMETGVVFLWARVCGE